MLLHLLSALPNKRNEKPESVHSGGFEPLARHVSAQPSVRETIASQRFCHSNLLERKPTMLSRMVQTETSQVIVDNRSCQIASDSPSHKRLSANSSNEYPHGLTTSGNSINCRAKDQLQSGTESTDFSNKSDMGEKLENPRSSFSENETSANLVVINQTTVSTSTEIRTTGDNESSETPQCYTEPPPYSRARSANSPRLMLSFNRTQVSSVTTPMKDGRQWTEECASPTVKDTIPRRLLSEFPHPKQINSNESSCVAIHKNVESVFEGDMANQPFTQRLADVTTVIGEDPGASNSSSFPTMQDIQNSDLEMQNILARDDSLFNDLSSLFGNSRGCDDLNTQKSVIETSEGTFLTTEGNETNKDKCEQAVIKTKTLKPETDSVKQHDNTKEKNNEQISMNETYSQLSPSSEDIPLDSDSADGQNIQTAANVEVPEPMRVVSDKTNLTQVSCSNDVLGSCLSVIQPNAENQFQSCNFDQNDDHTDSVIDVESTASNVNESSTLVSASVTENITGCDDARTLKPVSIGTPFQVGTQRVSQAACSVNQSIPTTQPIVCYPSSSVTNSKISFIPSNRNISILPAVQNQRFVLNPNFQISPVSQFCYSSTSGFPVQPLDGFQTKFVMIQQPYPSHSMNATNWTNNNLRNDISIPVQTESAESIARSQSFLANNVVTVTSETAQPKKAKNSLDKKKRQKASKKKSTHLKQKNSCKSPSCSPLKSAEYSYGKKKCMTKEKVEVTSDFVTNAIEKLIAHKAVSSSMSDIVLNAMQDALQSKPVKRENQDSSAVYNLFQKAEISVSPIKKTLPKFSSSNKKTVVPADKFFPKSSFDSDSESDNIPLSAIVASKLKSTLKIKETETYAHKQNNPQKSNLEKKTDKNIAEDIFPSSNTSSIKCSATNRIKSKALDHIQEATSKEIGNVKSTQSYIFSKVTGNSPSNPIVLGSDEDIEMSGIGNENVASRVICNTEGKSLKKEQKKKCKRKKQGPKLTLPSKEKTLSRKNAKRKNSSVSRKSNLTKISETSDNLLQNQKPDSLTEKSNYKISQESCIEKEILCNKKCKTQNSDRSHKLKEKTNINETNNHPLSNEETDIPPSKNECRTSQNSAMEKKQESGQKDKWHISSPQNAKEVSHPSSFENSPYSLRTIKSRNIDEVCDKLKLNAIRSSHSKEETLKPLTTTDRLLNTIRNSIEIADNETSLQHEPLPSETIVPVNRTENETLKLASTDIIGEENSVINTEVVNNITLDFEANSNSKQSSIGDQPVKSNVKRQVLPLKKRIRLIPDVSPHDSSFSPFSLFSSPVHAFCSDSILKPKDMPSITGNLSDSEVNKIVSYPPELDSPAHVICFDSTSRPEEMPPLTRNTSNAEINEIVSSPPKLNAPANVVCFDSPSKPKEMPSLSPVDVDAVKKCSSGKPKAAAGFFRSALSDRDSNLPISLDSMSSSLCMVDTFLPRKNLPPADTFKRSPNKENCPVNKISPKKKKTEKEGQKRKLAPISINSPGENLLPPSYPSSQVQLKDKRPKFRTNRNTFTQQIPAGVKIPPKWSNSKIKNYSSTISRAEDEVGSKAPRRSRPNIKVAAFKSSLKTNSSFKRKAEHPLDLSKQTKSS
ncbi:hypothetical protein AVEN_99354-1 [Araneus ventricosus]|uniref:Uncharacterized protein n=1 Tax=Araneus ventricosus TaxID=182803 RepID=A0A4Y2QWI0_ARAVE|nr:hypothetical protein AVEN_99354-1 [Araneus ventricosus]